MPRTDARDREVSSQRLTRPLGCRAIVPRHPKLATQHRMYPVGGTSPCGLRSRRPIGVDSTTFKQQFLSIDGGERGFPVSLSPADLQRHPLPILASLRRRRSVPRRPFLSAVDHDKAMRAAGALADFEGVARDLSLPQPRVKFLLFLRMGREPQRTHGHDPDHVVRDALPKCIVRSLGSFFQSLDPRPAIIVGRPPRHRAKMSDAMAARIKGATLLSTMALVREACPPQKYQELVASCPVATQKLLRGTLVALEWLSVDVWGPFLVALHQQLCRRDDAKMRKLMRAVFKRDFSTTYRALLAGLTPETLLPKLPTLWPLLLDGGTLRGQAVGNSGTVLIELREFATSTKIYTIVCEAFVEQLFSMVTPGRVELLRLREQHSDGQLSCDCTLTYERT